VTTKENLNNSVLYVESSDVIAERRVRIDGVRKIVSDCVDRTIRQSVTQGRSAPTVSHAQPHRASISTTFTSICSTRVLPLVIEWRAIKNDWKRYRTGRKDSSWKNSPFLAFYPFSAYCRDTCLLRACKKDRVYDRVSVLRRLDASLRVTYDIREPLLYCYCYVYDVCTVIYYYIACIHFRFDASYYHYPFIASILTHFQSQLRRNMLDAVDKIFRRRERKCVREEAVFKESLSLPSHLS